MIKAKLEAIVPEGIHDNFSAKEIWNRLAEQGELPRIIDDVPYTKESIAWGWLPEGIFFITGVARTESGFTAQVTLCPEPKCIETWYAGWLIKNLFCSKATHSFHAVFRGGKTDTTFILHNISRT